MGGRLSGAAGAPPPTGFSIDSRTLAAGELFFAIVAARDGHDFVADAVARKAAGVVVSRPVTVPAARAVRHRGGRHDAGACRTSRVTCGVQSGATRGGDHRQRREDDDEGCDRGVAGRAVSGGEEPGQPEQPPGIAAVAAGAETRSGCGRHGAGHESRRGDPRARRHRRTRRACLDSTSARRTSATSGRPTPSRTRRPRSSTAPRRRALLVANADDARVMARDAWIRGTAGDLRRQRARGRPRRGSSRNSASTDRGRRS